MTFEDFESSYANQYALDFYHRLTHSAHQEWLLEVISYLREKFPKADHYCIPSHHSLMIKIGRRKAKGKEASPVFHLYLSGGKVGFNLTSGSKMLNRLQDRLRVNHSVFDESRYISCQSPVHAVKHRVVLIEQELNAMGLIDDQSPLAGYGYVPKQYQDDQDIVTVDRFSVKRSSTNQIFYGPAGTGKTYHLQQLQAQYTEQRHQPDREEFLAELIRPLVWREVLLLVMLDLNKAVKKSDLMAHRFYQLKAQLNQRANQKGAGIWNVLNDHSIDVPKGAYSVRKEPLVFSELDKNYWIIANPDHDDVQEMRQLLDQIGRGPQGHQQVQRYSMVTFHQSYGYEDFIEGLRPVLNDDNPDGHVRYEIKQGVFVALCERARNDPEHQYAMFIDEINRGNVSKILGELITLIELDKRDGQANAIRVRLPASGAWFSVPANVSLYGSMNTADRSLTPLDTALRRRFECIEMMPDPEALGHRQIDGLDLTTLLHTLNARIELLLGRDALLGQAYFWSVTDLAGLQQVFLYKVLPLLQTYCYDQWQPIRLIFNDHRKPVELQWIQQIDDEARVRQWLGDDVAVAIQPTYRINHAAFADIDSYRMML